MRFPWEFCLALCVATGTLASAQDGIKIVSNWSTNWDIGSSITYIDGDHERREGYWGIRQPSDSHRLSDLSLRECGRWSASYIVHGDVFFDEAETGNSTVSAPKDKKSGGLIRAEIESSDTGERLPKFGFVARHIVTTVKYDLSQTSCEIDEISHKYDAWYVDWPYSNKCSEADSRAFSPSFPNCGDRIVVDRKGASPSGFPISVQEEILENGGRTIYMSDIVKTLTHEKLDPAMFIRPSNVLPISELGKNHRHQNSGGNAESSDQKSSSP